MAKITKIHSGKTPIRLHYLVEWLEKRDMSQAAVARELGIDKSTVSKWCAGALPQETNIIALASLLHIEPNDLFRHPDDDWMAKLFKDRSTEEKQRIISIIEAAMPRKAG